MTTGAPIVSPPLRNLLLVAFVGWLLQLANLHYVFAYGRAVGADYTRGADTPVYCGMANALQNGERLDPMYQERLLVPLILLGLRVVGWPDSVFPWLVSLFVIPAAVSIGWLGWLVTERRWVAYTASALTCIYPTAWQYGVLIETDTLHLYLGGMAVVGTILAKEYGGRWFIVSALTWPLVHLVRPALWGVGVVLPFFLYSRLKLSKDRWAAVLLCLGAWAVPCSFAAANYLRWGIGTPSLHTAEILFVWTRSRVRAVVESEQHGGDWTPLVRDAVAVARQDPRWSILHGEFRDPAEFARTYRDVMRESRHFLWAHKGAFIRTTLGEFLHQCTAPLRYYHHYGVPSLSVLYPNMERALRMALKLSWWFGLCGLAWVIGGRHGSVAFFVLAVAAMNYIPSSLSCWAGARIRMISDVLGIPFMAAAAAQGLPWVGLLLLILAAYTPRRLGLSAAYYNIAASVVTAIWMVLMLRKARRVERFESPKETNV